MRRRMAGSATGRGLLVALLQGRLHARRRPRSTPTTSATSRCSRSAQRRPPTSCRTCSTATPAAAVRGRADHRRGQRQRRRRPRCAAARSTSTPSRSTRSSTQIGRRDHPDQPYDDPRVSRPPRRRPQLRPQDRPASTTWWSTRWSTRWCCTRATRASAWRASCSPSEAFADVKRTLKPDGVFAMYNYLPPGLGRRPAGEDGRGGLRREAAGHLAAVPARQIKPGDNQVGHITFLLVGTRFQAPGGDPDASSARGESFWVQPQARAINEAINGFGRAAGGRRGARLAPQIAPRDASIPPASTGCRPTTGRSSISASRRSLGAHRPGHARRSRLLSLAILLAFAPAGPRPAELADVLPGRRLHAAGDQGRGPHGPALRLTWVVNSIVFFAILVMILLSNLFVLAVKPRAPGALLRCCWWSRCWSTRWCR